MTIKHNRDGIFIRLETERLILKPIDLSDKEFICRHFRDDSVTQFLLDNEPYSSPTRAEALIRWYITPEPRGHNRWIIIRKRDNLPLGTCGFHNWDTWNHICDIGYDLSREYWGEGYMAEALKRALKMGFEDMSLNRIQAFVYVDNIRSVNVLTRLGFSKEGIIRDKHFFRGKYYDHFCFSLLKSEW